MSSSFFPSFILPSFKPFLLSSPPSAPLLLTFSYGFNLQDRWRQIDSRQSDRLIAEKGQETAIDRQTGNPPLFSLSLLKLEREREREQEYRDSPHSVTPGRIYISSPKQSSIQHYYSLTSVISHLSLIILKSYSFLFFTFNIDILKSDSRFSIDNNHCVAKV